MIQSVTDRLPNSLPVEWTFVNILLYKNAFLDKN